MKKIGFVIPWFGENIPGGAEMELRGLTQHLFAAGVELEVLTTCVKQFSADWSENYYKPGTDTVCGVPVRRFLVKKRNTTAFDTVNGKLMRRFPVTLAEEETFFREMVNSFDLYAYMKEKQEEYALFVFIPYMFGTTYYGVLACPEKAVVIPCLHDEPYAHMALLKEAFQKVRGMCFLADPERELACRLYDLNPQTALTLGAGLDTDIIGNAQRFRKNYDITGSFILYAGRKDKGKNVDTLLAYFLQYKKRSGREIQLVLIGGGDITIPKEYRQDVVDLGFVSTQDKYDAYAAATLLCQPSKNESFSLVIMESWLCGRPVMVHKDCEVTKHFASTSNGGFYFDGYWEFEGCVDYLFSHPEVADKMGENGRGYVLENFSWNVIVKKYRAYFEGLSEARE